MTKTITPQKPETIIDDWTLLPESDTLFPPSAELGESIRRLHEEQAEIDRQQAEKLAKLRAIQDKD
jgi:hypothetical protein